MIHVIKALPVRRSCWIDDGCLIVGLLILFVERECASDSEQRQREHTELTLYVPIAVGHSMYDGIYEYDGAAPVRTEDGVDKNGSREFGLD